MLVGAVTVVGPERGLDDSEVAKEYDKVDLPETMDSPVIFWSGGRVRVPELNAQNLSLNLSAASVADRGVALAGKTGVLERTVGKGS